jgi:SRSO17 transposase
MKWNQKMWQRSVKDFGEFIEPIIGTMGRSERREGAALYLQGLLMPGERKSIEPMAQRLRADSQKLQQLIADSPWEDEGMWGAIRQEIIPTFGTPLAWIVDETGWLKQGKKSVGVAHQYCGAVGKQGNCQISVEVVISDGEIAAPVAGRLYLPSVWTEDRLRCDAAGVPPTIGFESKPLIALDLIREVAKDGVSHAPVLGDEVYGTSSELRRGLRELGLEYFFHAGDELLAWTKRPQTRLGRKHWGVAHGEAESVRIPELVRAMNKTQWRAAAWRAADGSQRQTRIAWLPVYLQSDLDSKTGDWPQSWLVADWPANQAEPFRFYTAWFKAPPLKNRCLQLSRGRCAIEQFFQRDKTDLGLDQYEGRSWRGFHHHLVLAALAYLFVSAVYLRSKKNSWCYVGSGVASDPAVVHSLERILPLLQNGISGSGIK